MTHVEELSRLITLYALDNDGTTAQAIRRIITDLLWILVPFQPREEGAKPDG